MDQSAPLGVATTRYDERILSSVGKLCSPKIRFERSQALSKGGILFLLPALLSQGILKVKEVYSFPRNYYYDLVSIILTLAFMALLRIKNPEQLKQCKPGELGRIIGLDRLPEVRCLRKDIKELTIKEKALEFNNILINHWYENDNTDKSDNAFLYIDGHVRIYYGSKANLPVKYVSRQKLCLSATSEYWVNDAKGMPVMVVLGELTEKLQHIIEDKIIPQLKQTVLLKDNINDQDEIQCTFVFDREAYEPAFFKRLLKEHNIAVVTYRKNVRDKWSHDLFKSYRVKVLDQSVTMQLYERYSLLSGYEMREIRRLSKDGHQTAIITTHPDLEISEVAGRMFSRWSQENFFRYLIRDYDFDKIIEYGVEKVDPEAKVVNPEYRKITHKIKKLREKRGRIEAKFYPLLEKVMDETIDKIPKITSKQMEYKEMINRLSEGEKQLIQQREQIPARIKIIDMPEQKRYNKLKTESKLLMNIIKMISYRAESSLSGISAEYLGKGRDEKRMFVKQIINTPADIIPDYGNNTLTVVLYSLSSPRYNIAAHKITKLLNETETIFPGTTLRLVFKTTASSVCEM